MSKRYNVKYEVAQRHKRVKSDNHEFDNVDDAIDYFEENNTLPHLDINIIDWIEVTNND